MEEGYESTPSLCTALFLALLQPWEVASSRFPEAAERAHQGRDNRNSGPGLEAVWHCLAGGLGKVLTLGFGPAEP